MRLREYLDKVISFNSVNPCNTIGFAPSVINDDPVVAVEKFLSNFAVSYRPVLGYVSGYTIIPENFVWMVKCPKAELYMKFSSIGFNPPGGAVGDSSKAGLKTLLWYRDLAIAVLPDIVSNEFSYVILTTLDAKVELANGTSY